MNLYEMNYLEHSPRRDIEEDLPQPSRAVQHQLYIPR